MLLIVTLIFGMTSNHFAISDFAYVESAHNENYYEEMTEETQESTTYEDIENEEIVDEEFTNEYEEEPEEELVNEYEKELEEEPEEESEEELANEYEEEPEEELDENIEESLEDSDYEDEEESINENTENVMTDESSEEEIEEIANDEIATESEIELEESEEIIDDEVTIENETVIDEEVATESEIINDDEVATESEMPELASLSMPLLMTAPLFGATTPHYHDVNLYTAIYNESDLSSITSSYVYLENDLEINNSISLSHFDDSKLFICLNGKKLTFTYDKNIFTVGDGEMLTITDCNSAAGTLTIATADEAYDGRKTLIKAQGTGEVNVEKINIGPLEFYGTMFEANDGGCINVTDIKMEACSYVDAAFYAHGAGSKISFLGNNHILGNEALNESILFANNNAEIEIVSGETIFEGNIGKTGGIAKLTDHSEFIIEGNLIATFNEAEKGGFAYVDNTASFHSSSGVINIENCHAVYGGGLYIDVINTEPFIDNSLVYNIKNNFAFDAGGGVYLYFNVDADFMPDTQDVFNFYENNSLHGAGLYISGSTGKNANIKNLSFYEHSLDINESLIEVDINIVIDNLKLEATNKNPDEIGNFISKGTLIKVVANNNIVKIQNIFLSNDSDKLNRVYKGIELAKTNDKTIDLTISTYSLVDKIALGIDISHIEDDGISKVQLSHIFANFTTDSSTFKIPRLEEFPQPDNFYTALSSLTGNGTKALSLDYIPGFNTRWDIQYKFGSYPKSIGAWPYTSGTYYDNGSNQNQKGRFGFLGLNSNQIQVAFGKSANSYSNYCKTSQAHTMYVDAYNRKGSNGVDTAHQGNRGMNYTTSGRFINGVSPLYIFGASSNTGSTRTPHAGTVYTTNKISEKGVLVRDFIPVKLTTDIPKSMDHYGISRSAGSTGLWDKIEEEFYEYIGGIATSEITENGINIIDSKIPITIENLNISGSPKRSVYIESSKNVDLIDTTIENANASTDMGCAYIKIVENSEVSFDGITNVKNNTTQKNSIIDIKNNSKVLIKGTAIFSNNTCVLNTDKLSSVICVENGAKLYIKTEDISFENNLTKKGVIGIYDSAGLYIHGYFYMLNNHIYGDASKTLNIYLGSAGSAIYYDEEENDPIKATSKIGITKGSLNNVVFKYWNEDSIEKFNDGSDTSKEIYLPDNIFIPDTAHISANQLLYKQGIYPETCVYIGTSFVTLNYKYEGTLIGSQRIAKNVETTIDSIYLVGTPAEIQGWVGPSLENENKNVHFGITDTTKTVKVSANKDITYDIHIHTIYGDSASSVFTFVKDESEFAYKLNKYKTIYLAGDIELTNKVNIIEDADSDNALYSVCLNGYSLTFANGKNIFDISGNKKFVICNCKTEGAVGINTENQLGSDAAINVSNGDFTMYNTKIGGLNNCKTSLINITGASSKLQLSDIEFKDNILSGGNFINISNIDKATFSNIIAANNTFSGSSQLINISDTKLCVDNVEIYDNKIKESLITVKNVETHASSTEDYKVHDNISSSSIITLGGNVNLVGKKENNIVGEALYYIKDGTVNIDGNHTVIDSSDRAIFIDNANVVIKNIDIKNCGKNGEDGGAIYLSRGSFMLDDNISLDGNINAIYNNAGKLYIRNPQNTSVNPNIEIKNGSGRYVLSASKVENVEFYLLGGKIYDNNTENVYIRKNGAVASTKKVAFYIGGNFAIEVTGGNRGIYISDHEQANFKEYTSLAMTNDCRLSYYVEFNATRIFSSFTNQSINKDVVFTIEDANRDPERPMYLDQYEDTKDLYVYYKSIKLEYKYKITGNDSVFDLNLQKNQQLPRRVTYDTASEVIIGHPSLSGHTFTGWDGPDIATPNTLDDIVLKNLTDMTTRCYTAYFKPVSRPGGGSSSGGGGGGGGGGKRTLAATDGMGDSIPKQEDAKSIAINTTEIVLSPALCEWIYNPVLRIWSLNIKVGNEKIKATNGFYAMVKLDSKGKVSKSVFYFDSLGNMYTGWGKDANGSLYYFNAKNGNDMGKMAVGWTEIEDSVWYCFDNKGKLYVNGKTPDGKTVGADGSWKGPFV